MDDAYEEISYKIEMTIKNRQSYAENDSDHMEVSNGSTVCAVWFGI